MLNNFFRHIPLGFSQTLKELQHSPKTLELPRAQTRVGRLKGLEGSRQTESTVQVSGAREAVDVALEQEPVGLFYVF